MGHDAERAFGPGTLDADAHQELRKIADDVDSMSKRWISRPTTVFGIGFPIVKIAFTAGPGMVTGLGSTNAEAVEKRRRKFIALIGKRSYELGIGTIAELPTDL